MTYLPWVLSSLSLKLKTVKYISMTFEAVPVGTDIVISMTGAHLVSCLMPSACECSFLDLNSTTRVMATACLFTAVHIKSHLPENKKPESSLGTTFGKATSVYLYHFKV